MRGMIGVLVVICILAPLVGAQDAVPPVEQIEWTLITNRTLVWVGDTITVAANGSANTTVTLELRPWNNMTLEYGNISWSEIRTTDVNGSAIFLMETDDIRETGEYYLLLTRNAIVLKTVKLTINMDPERYQDMRIDENGEHDDQQDADIQGLVAELADVLKFVDKLFWLIGVLIAVFIAYVVWTLELQINYHIYKRQKAGKRPRFTWLLSDDNSEFFHQAGGIIYEKPPVLPAVVNGVNVAGTNMAGKTNREIAKEINARLARRKGAVVQKMQPVGPQTRKERKEARKSAAEVKKDAEKVVEKEGKQ